MPMVVLIAEANDLLRAGLHAIFASDTRVKHIQEVRDQNELQRLISLPKWDLLVINANLVSDFSLLPPGKFVILTSELNMDFFQQACKYRARAYLLQDASAALFLTLLHCNEDFFLIDPSLALQIIEDLSRDTKFDANDDLLTPREKEIICLLREGVDRRIIAQKLYISEATLKTHLKNIRKKQKKTLTV